MPWAAAGAVAGALIVSKSQSDAADKASAAQEAAAEEGISEERRQFERIQEILSPYREAGESSLQAQQQLLGISGNQQEAIDQLKQSAMFNELAQQGETALLQNASATGGLRGGDIQGALSQFRPNLLNSLIQQQYQNLGSLTSIGQASAAGQANLGQATGSNIAGLYGNIGAAQAGSALAQGAASGQLYGGIARGIGYAAPAISDYYSGNQSVANQYGTTAGSEQTSMLAAQNSGFRS